MKRILPIVLLAACNTAARQPVKPLEMLPAAAVDVICARLHAEGMTSEIRFVKQTQPIVTPGALRALGEASAHRGSPSPDLVQAMVTTPLVPVETPARSCGRFVSAAEAARAHDVMIVEFSSPIVNPFTRGQRGAFARLSLAGESSSWYWIPLAQYNDRWIAAAPATLSFVE